MSAIGSSHVGGFASARVLAAQLRGLALDAGEDAAKALASFLREGHLDLGLVARIALEIGAAHQRPVDAGRRNLQPVFAVDRILHVENRRERTRDRLAILDRHRAVGPLRHDLHGAALRGGHPHAHQPVAHAGQHRRGDRGDACGHALLDDEPGLGDILCLERFGHAPAAPGFG